MQPTTLPSLASQALLALPRLSLAGEAALLSHALEALGEEQHIHLAPRTVFALKSLAEGSNPLAAIAGEGAPLREIHHPSKESDQRSLAANLATGLCDKIASHASFELIAACLSLLLHPFEVDRKTMPSRISRHSMAAQIFQATFESLAAAGRAQAIADGFSLGICSMNFLSTLAINHPQTLDNPEIAAQAKLFLASEAERFCLPAWKSSEMLFALRYPACFFFSSSPLWMDAVTAPFDLNASPKAIAELLVLRNEAHVISISTEERSQKIAAMLAKQGAVGRNAKRPPPAYAERERNAAAKFLAHINAAIGRTFRAFAEQNPPEAARCFFSMLGTEQGASKWKSMGLHTVDASSFLSAQLPSLRNVRVVPPHACWPIETLSPDPLSHLNFGYLESLVFSGGTEAQILKALADGERFLPSFDEALKDRRIAVQFSERRLFELASLSSCPSPSKGKITPRL